MLTRARVLLVSDESPRTSTLQQQLASVGHEIASTHLIDDAERRIAQGEADVTVVDHESHGLAELERLVGASTGCHAMTFVVLTRGAPASAVREAARLAACEVVDGTSGDDALVLAVDRAAREGQLMRELAMLRSRVGDVAMQALVGRSNAMAHVRELVGRAAGSRAPVLITGEAGTGKDAVARLVHDLSSRASRPFATVRCGDADPSALELELFGRTASDKEPARAGLLEEARGGTVVLDDASALPSSLRAQIARASATRTTRRVGATTSLPADVRLILTLRIASAIADDRSHEDLLGRFNAMPIVLPPLRERRSDIPQLVQHFRRRVASDQGIELAALSPDDMLPLLGREWSGNVRELEHWVERSALSSSAEQSLDVGRESGGDLVGLDLGAARATLEQLERVYILHVLEQEAGHQSRAAVRLGIDRRTLYRKLKQYRSEERTDGMRRAG
ncbi:MAG: sigma 54-interacting transcriptional regulator [bacterium]